MSPGNTELYEAGSREPLVKEPSQFFPRGCLKLTAQIFRQCGSMVISGVVRANGAEKRGVANQTPKHVKRPGSLPIAVRIQQLQIVHLRGIDYRPFACDARLNDLAAQGRHPALKRAVPRESLHPEKLHVGRESFREPEMAPL